MLYCLIKVFVLISDKYKVQVDCANLRKIPVEFTEFSVSQQGFFIFRNFFSPEGVQNTSPGSNKGWIKNILKIKKNGCAFWYPLSK